MPRWTLENGQLRRDGEALLTMGRAQWGDGATPAATLDALKLRIIALLNADDDNEARVAARYPRIEA